MDIAIKVNELAPFEFKITGTYAGSLIDDLANTFSVSNPNAFFAKQYGFKMPTKIYGVSPFGTFRHGLIFDVLKYLHANYANLNITMTDQVKRIIASRLPLRKFANSDLYTGPQCISNKIEMRPYQMEIIDAIITRGYGRCMFECPTGSGKSFIIANLIYTLQQEYKQDLRTLLFLPNAQLVKQFYKDLIDYGFPTNSIIEFSANSYKKLNKNEINDKQVVIANRQFLFNHGHEVGDFDMVVIDEVHSASVATSQTAKFIQLLTAPIKIGCSGTIPVDLAKYWTLLNLTGPVIYKETITHLQDEGYLANVKFVTIKVKDHIVENDKDLLFNLNPRVKYSAEGDSQIAFSEPYAAETEYMSKNCMDLYSPILTNPKIKFAKNENTLILFDRIEFGKALYEYLKSINFNDAQIYYIDGSVPIDQRETIRSLCETSQNVIIVAQVAVMSTGINIKNMSNLVMTGSSKSQSRTIQSIGRTLRLHGSKSHATIWDIVFNYKYSKKHYLERSALYKKYYNRSKPDEVINIEIGN
jgi:superfamily II DNA or RNA helicase